MGSSNRTYQYVTGVLFALWTGYAAAQDCAPDSVFIKGDWGQARFSVEIADTDALRARGLMYRDHLAASAGMLFVYDVPGPLSFWMRNTRIPLDIIFIDQTGTVRRVHPMATPFDETPIYGGDNLTHVLEINGGLAKRLGLDAGSAVRHESFYKNSAAWPC